MSLRQAASATSDIGVSSLTRRTASASETHARPGRHREFGVRRRIAIGPGARMAPERQRDAAAFAGAADKQRSGSGRLAHRREATTPGIENNPRRTGVKTKRRELSGCDPKVGRRQGSHASGALGNATVRSASAASAESKTSTENTPSLETKPNRQHQPDSVAANRGKGDLNSDHLTSLRCPRILRLATHRNRVGRPDREECRRMKKLVVLSDGTGNSAGKRHKTNVWRLYAALDLHCKRPGRHVRRWRGVAEVSPVQAARRRVRLGA